MDTLRQDDLFAGNDTAAVACWTQPETTHWTIECLESYAIGLIG